MREEQIQFDKGERSMTNNVEGARDIEWGSFQRLREKLIGKTWFVAVRE